MKGMREGGAQIVPKCVGLIRIDAVGRHLYDWQRLRRLHLQLTLCLIHRYTSVNEKLKTCYILTPPLFKTGRRP